MSRSYASSPRYQQYSSRFDRGKTFWAWQHIKPSYQECVNAGFFFQGDKVRCFCCGIGFKDFCEFDNLMEEHIRHSPTCAFLESLYGVPGLQQRHRQILSEDENMRVIHNQYTECTRNEVNNKPYRHPELYENDRRLATFQNPNFQSVLTPERLADAGLYYTGEGDHVRCFACGGGLRRWEVNDGPWTEHCRWFPSCRFAREVKGDAFIANILKKTSGPRIENPINESSNLQYRYPEHAETEARLTSFHNAKNRFPFNVKELARAGLFYIGSGDCVRCFACGTGLKNWKVDSDPLLEHMKWSPTCTFLTELIGEYVASNSLKTHKGESVVTSRNMQNDIAAFFQRFHINDTNDHQVPVTSNGFTCTEIEEETKMHDSIELRNQLNEMVAENTNLKERITCQSCRCSNNEIVVLPCQHWVMCKRCAFTRKTFPVCNIKVEDRIPALLMRSTWFIEKENARLKKQLFCQKCNLNKTNALFLPCAHHVLCSECARGIAKCYICNCDATCVIRTYMS